MSKKVSSQNNRWILLTGLSGSGKTTALKVFEDQGFSVIDNLPVPLLPSLIKIIQSRSQKNNKLVLGMDVRGQDFLSSYPQVIELLEEAGSVPEILFFECKEKSLLQRFSETRRPHPLQSIKSNLRRAVAEEKKQLEPLRKIATKIFDTTDWNIHQLKKALHRHLAISEEITAMTLTLMSFGYKFGAPAEADMIFDVRFLKNPYFEPRLKHRPGTSPSVQKFISSQKETQQFLRHTTNFLKFLIPKFKMEGKANFTIGIGCTGGRHRSVAITEFLEKNLGPKEAEIIKIHRDLAKGLK